MRLQAMCHEPRRSPPGHVRVDDFDPVDGDAGRQARDWGKVADGGEAIINRSRIEAKSY
ncbi:hypothetical protein SPHV1_2310083 [Novosphingobium sp. KN65.2]|nr:hypothetical protein SPHV1_2310083 [Novosphingobium sp. KN65.2]